MNVQSCLMVSGQPQGGKSSFTTSPKRSGWCYATVYFSVFYIFHSYPLLFFVLFFFTWLRIPKWDCQIVVCVCVFQIPTRWFPTQLPAVPSVCLRLCARQQSHVPEGLRWTHRWEQIHDTYIYYIHTIYILYILYIIYIVYNIYI